MNASQVRSVVAVLLIAVAPVATRAAEATVPATPVTVHLGPGSALWLAGTSTLHDFESRTTATVITLTRDPASAEPRDASSFATLMRAAAFRDMEVVVPVRTLKSEKEGLDKNLWKTLKADEFANIVFHLERYAARDSGAGDTLSVTAQGTLTVVGQARPVTLTARAYPGEGGMWIEGRHVLRMTEFGIKPPKMMLGTIRVGDRITVGYRLLLATDRSGSATVSGDSTPERSR